MEEHANDDDDDEDEEEEGNLDGKAEWCIMSYTGTSRARSSSHCNALLVIIRMVMIAKIFRCISLKHWLVRIKIRFTDFKSRELFVISIYCHIFTLNLRGEIDQAKVSYAHF